MTLEVRCHACGATISVAPASIEAKCGSCGARVTLTALETGIGPSGKRGAVHAENLLGAVLGGYRLRSVLGGGGMGIVFEAERESETGDGSGPEVAAVKVLAPMFTDDPHFVERFRREADALTQLRHPNLIEVYGRGEHEFEGRTYYYFVMERFFGRDLRSVVREGPVEPATAFAIIRQAAMGLAEAHRAGIVHRDVKPANILVEGDPAHGGRVKVVDFGVAQLASANFTLTSLTSSSLILGTINYMSPEQRIDAAKIDHRADIYALGVVAYELLTGKLPMGAFEAPSAVSGRGTRATDRAVLAALRQDPAQRPKSAIAFAELLENAALATRRLIQRAGIGLAATAVAIAGAWVVTRPSPTAQLPAKEAPSFKQASAAAAPDANVPDAAPAFVPSPALTAFTSELGRLGTYAISRSRVTTRPLGTKIAPKKRATKKPNAKRRRSKKGSVPSSSPNTDAAKAKPTEAK